MVLSDCASKGGPIERKVQELVVERESNFSLASCISFGLSSSLPLILTLRGGNSCVNHQARCWGVTSLHGDSTATSCVKAQYVVASAASPA
jgi:hypothetical protein